jgi:hypothetical protein
MKINKNQIQNKEKIKKIKKHPFDSLYEYINNPLYLFF